MRLPHRQKIKVLLTASLSPESAGRVVGAAEERYRQAVSLDPGKASHQQYTRQVLPIFVLFQTLTQEEGLERAEALALLQPVFLETYFGSLRRGLLLFAKMTRALKIQPFPLIRVAMRNMSLSVKGTEPELIEDSAQRLIVHCHRCPILEMFVELGEPELAKLYCASDDWLASAMPRLRWLRSATLANGGEVCDFHWARD